MAETRRSGLSVDAGPLDLATLLNRFAEFCDAAPHERALWLDELERRDPAGARMLRRMLEAEASGQARTLDTPLLDLDAELIAGHATIDAMPSHAPSLGGRYEVLRPLGFGANGDVYLARQRQPVERDVAIKVLRPSQVRASTIERMAREAKALAVLSHPNIATVFEAGQTDDGRPFIATEFVAGEPIDAWCTSTAASARARILTLARVCRAVEHMHQRGIIHRDLKPTNILVSGTPHDPIPKILDLGIAKIIGDEAHAVPTLTQQGALLGSLGYIAPEQFKGAPADTRSDIFALGRVLEKLLDGPQEPWLVRHARDAAAIIREALQPDPDRRYQSAGELADDLDALLCGRAVSARRQTLVEASLRLVRRHKAATLLAAIALVSVIGAAGVVGHKSAQLAEAKHAQKEILKDTLDGLVRILGRYPGTRDERLALADRMEANLATLMMLNPEDRELRVLRARVIGDRASIAITDGRFEDAEPRARHAAAVMAENIDPATAGVEEVRQLAHAIITWGDSLHHLGRTEEARTQHERAMAIHKLAKTRYPDHIGLLDDLCWSYDRLGRWFRPSPDEYAEQKAWGEERLELARRLLALDPQRALSKYNLAMAHYRLACVDERQDAQRSLDHAQLAIPIFEELLAGDPGRGGYIHILGYSHNMVARVLHQQGASIGAIDHLERAVTILLTHVSTFNVHAESPDPTSARILFSVAVFLANLYEQMGREGEIAPLLAACAPHADPGKMAGYANDEKVDLLMQRWIELHETHDR